MMRIAILADVHANLPAFEAALADAAKYECERIYHAGDLISIGPYPSCSIRRKVTDESGSI